jgi:2-C-methyl-D-erythritol 4-phosphate cytidylyltransferase
MKKAIPKQHILLHGKPIIMHILERIDTIEEIDQIIITCPKNFISETKAIHKSYNLTKPCKFIEGGDTRQESVYLALKHITSPIVLIHEAVRPFVRKEEFISLIKHPANNAVLGTDIPFTVLKGKDYIEQLLERSTLINVQLPQKFETKKLLYAHQEARKENKHFTEDASLFITYNSDKVSIIPGTEFNIKITKPIDLKIAEVIYRHYIQGEE